MEPDRDLPVADVDVIGVLLLGVGRCVREYAARNDGNAVGPQLVDVHVVRDPRILLDHGVQANGEFGAQGNIDDQVFGGTDRIGPVRRASGDAGAAGKPVELRLVRDVSHRAAQRAGPVERTLRSAQDFHPVNVDQGEIGEQRRVVHVGGHRRHRRHPVVPERSGIHIDAAHLDVRGCPLISGAPIHQRHAGYGPQKFRRRLDLAVLDLLPGDRGDVVRDVEHLFVPTGRRDDDLGQGLGLGVHGGRRCRLGLRSPRQQGRAHGRRAEKIELFHASPP